MRFQFVIALLCLCIASLTGGCQNREEAEEQERARLLGEHRPFSPPPGPLDRGRIYLAPVGDMPEKIMSELREVYHNYLGLNVAVGPRVPIPASAYDAARGQVRDDRLVDELLRRHPVYARTCLIGITDKDMYAATQDWQFSFSSRVAGPEGNVAIISMARMDPVFHGKPADGILRNARLRKMITRNIGFLYFGLEPSNDPDSTLYAQVMELGDLDRMGQGY